MKTIVLGPPGTGKTHTLLNEVDKCLKQTDPNKIGYFSFTQKAAYEARDRAMKKFDYTEDDLPYFRTLHSLAFRRLGIKKENVMQKRHYEDLGKKIDFPVDYMEYDDEEGGIFTTKSDYLRIIQLAKLRNITISQQYDLQEHTQDISNQVEDLILFQHHEEHGWHGRDLGGFDALNLCAVDVHLLVGIKHVGIHAYAVAVEVYHHTGNHVAVFHFNNHLSSKAFFVWFGIMIFSCPFFILKCFDLFP